VIIAAFLGLFVVIGSGAGYFMSARPLYQAWQASSWTPTRCEVISSRVDQRDDTARVDIAYRYSVDDRVYTANRYDFIPGSTSDKSVPATVAAHPPGRVFECYVDPADPTNAVINRTPTHWYYMGLLFFLAFAGVPGAIGLFVLRRPQRSDGRALSAAVPVSRVGDGRFPSTTTLGGGDGAPVVMRPVASPLTSLLVALGVCLFVNGIVGVFTYFEIKLFREGQGMAWFLALFLLIFQVVAVACIVWVFRQLLALTNPRPVLTFSRGSVPLGGSVSIGWELTGAAHRVTHLTMTLKGREEARYRRGTDTHTDTHVFFTETLVDVSHAGGIARGSGTLRVPADTMHTFVADNNKVIWTLHVVGEINRWPDMEEDFDVTVRSL
jgi:hypothetical protein